MINYALLIEYDGTRYNGWQKQGNTPNTIQERFENILFKLCGKKVEIFASGRTDKGVHAKGQVANFKCEIDMHPEEIKDYFNKYLPEDIRIINAKIEDERFHSRLNAKSKTYEYNIATVKPSVFNRKYVYHTEDSVNVEKMKRAAAKLLGTHDFIGFSSVKKTKKSTIRTINSIDILEESGIITIRINGNGFLYNMVRIITGTLFEIGTGKKEAGVIDEVFKLKERSLSGETLPACGLTLESVYY
ncbi:MAG: tRNA pseudouridine(38-40) synthase TruA [Clostridia bacterium]|nr:tRNA pseudouridine(38-40) synthase TruA [Clostridia bacterium]